MLEEFKEELGIKNYILDYYIEEQEKLGLINKEFGVQNFENQGISDSFNTGNYMDGFKLIGLGLANSAPVSMSMMIGGAYMKTAQYLAAGTIGFAGKEIRENSAFGRGNLVAKYLWDEWKELEEQQ